MKQKLLITRIADTKSYLLNETIHDSIIPAVATTIQHEDINDLEEDDLLKLVEALNNVDNIIIEKVIVYDYKHFNRVVAINKQGKQYLISVDSKHEYKLDDHDTSTTLLITRSLEQIIFHVEKL